jgi:RNA polymerase sigma factor (sigma-70 family)
VKDGEDEAAQRLYDRYSQQVAQLALANLGRTARRVAGEEDVVQEVFFCLLRGAAQGQFPQLHDRGDLWRLLLVLTERRAVDQRRHEHALKRGGGQVRDEQSLCNEAEACGNDLAELVSRDPTPADAAIIADSIRERFGRLDGELRRVALLKLEQFTHPEIAERLGLSLPTVERKVRRIRSIWEHAATDAA